MDVIETYHFSADDLAVSDRKPGISAVMRTRNGAEFLEASIRSFIHHVDEIVAVFNRCDDATPDILARLEVELAPKLRVFDYRPAAYPPRTHGYSRAQESDPASFATFSNFALTRSRFSTVTLLDDDHVGIGSRLADITTNIRKNGSRLRDFWAYSGLNLVRNGPAGVGVLGAKPVAGNRDHGFLTVTPETWFRQGDQHEIWQKGRARTRFCGYLYWHLRFAKENMGFDNYELDANPGSEMWKIRDWAEASEILDLDQLREFARWNGKRRLRDLIAGRNKFQRAQMNALEPAFPHRDLAAALRDLSPELALDLDVGS